MKELILFEYNRGNVVFRTGSDMQSCNLQDFIKQPVESILYDLNRDEATVLAFASDPKWVNDYAVCKVIKALKARIDELENK